MGTGENGGMSSGPEREITRAAHVTADDSPSTGITVAALARRLGVAPATLRTWDRRYGLGPTQHAAGAHRRYSQADVERLERMRRLVISGIPLADAARLARLDESHESSLLPPQGVGRPGGGQVVPIPGGTPNARGLARAAVALDSLACREIIAETLDRRGLVWTWDHLLVPVLVGLGQKWEQSGKGIEVEHVLSEAIQAELSERVARSRVSAPAPVLLCSAPNDLHVLALWAVAAGLAERHVSVRMLGARTPIDALAAAIRRIGPGGVLVWSQTSESGDPAMMSTLPELRPEPMIFLGGPGWWPGETPRSRRVGDLTEAITVLSRAAGA